MAMHMIKEILKRSEINFLKKIQKPGKELNFTFLKRLFYLFF